MITLLIALSMMFLKQHSVIDVTCAVAVCAAVDIAVCVYDTIAGKKNLADAF